MIVLFLACASGPSIIAPSPNILLVSMDTVRYDHTSLDGGRNTTPNLSKLAAEGASWSRAYAVGNESLYSHAALFTGRYPSEIAFPDYATYSLPKTATTLASVLRAYGYRTGAFTGGGHVIAAFGFDNGFDTFEAASGATRFGSFFDSVPRAVTWMAEPDPRPWFAFVHGYDAHSPYVQRGPFLHPWGTVGATPRVEAILADPLAVEKLRGSLYFPDRTPTDFVHAVGRTVLSTDFYRMPAEPAPGERVETLTEAELQHIRDHYDSGLLYADFWLGELLSHVDLTTTLVIVVADHGEDLLDHGYMNHRAGLWDSTLHVPLVVAGPFFGPGGLYDGQHDELVDLRRVMPTAMLAAGIGTPDGVSARPLQWAVGDDAVFAEGVMGTMSAYDGVNWLTVDGLRTAPPPDHPLAPAMTTWRLGLRLATETGDPVSLEVWEGLRKQGYWTPDP
ncbi:hypothetical protein LBMAG42_54950 [Deltaproteobacteria bacterium]|nr:hypothetical protein LBMAG42_54950 [Deltaproteobacteria bacterium]